MRNPIHVSKEKAPDWKIRHLGDQLIDVAVLLTREVALSQLSHEQGFANRTDANLHREIYDRFMMPFFDSPGIVGLIAMRTTKDWDTRVDSIGEEIDSIVDEFDAADYFPCERMVTLFVGMTLAAKCHRFFSEYLRSGVDRMSEKMAKDGTDGVIDFPEFLSTPEAMLPPSITPFINEN